VQVRFIAVLSEPEEEEVALKAKAAEIKEEAAHIMDETADGEDAAAYSDVDAADGGMADGDAETASGAEAVDGVAAAAGSNGNGIGESAPAVEAEAVETEPEAAEAVETEPESAEAVETEPESAEAVETEPEAAEAEGMASRSAPKQPPAEAELSVGTEPLAPKKPGRRRLTLVLRYMVNPASLLPLYAVTVDMDLHPHLGQPLKVKSFIDDARPSLENDK